MLKLSVLLVLVGLESTEVKAGLILVIATPLRTRSAVAKEEHFILFCTEKAKFGQTGWYQNYWLKGINMKIVQVHG